MSALAPVLLIGPKNAEAATGLPWRHLRAHAPALGVPVLRIGRKVCIPAQALLAALLESSTRSEPENPEEAILRSLGLVRRTG